LDEMRQEEDSRSKQPIRKRSKKRNLKIPGIFLIILGLGVMAYPFTTSLVNQGVQKRLRSEWSDKKKNVKLAQTESAGPTGANNVSSGDPKKDQKAGEPTLKLIIPGINLNVIVVEGTSPDCLKKGPGHMKKTVLPGEKGVSVISGHRTTHGAPFFKLGNLRDGDRIIIETMTAQYVFQVYETKEVSPNDTSFIKPSDESILALTTCTPIYSARRRLVILARLES